MGGHHLHGSWWKVNLGGKLEEAISMKIEEDYCTYCHGNHKGLCGEQKVMLIMALCGLLILAYMIITNPVK